MLDTTTEALRVQTKSQQRLGGTGRLWTTCRMSQMLRDCALDRIRAEAPHLDDAKVMDRLIYEFYGFRRDA